MEVTEQQLPPVQKKYGSKFIRCGILYASLYALIMSVIGAKFSWKCPAQDMIPMWNFYMSIGVMLMGGVVLFRFDLAHEMNKLQFKVYVILSCIICTGVFSLLIYGTIIVVDCDDCHTYSETKLWLNSGCDQTIYVFTCVHIGIEWILVPTLAFLCVHRTSDPTTHNVENANHEHVVVMTEI